MAFSSVTFLIYFLPVCLGVYFLLPAITRSSMILRNTILLIFSLLFYALGDLKNIPLLTAIIFSNYLFCIAISYFEKARKLIFFFAINFNILTLIYYKYLNFFTNNISLITEHFDVSFKPTYIELPLGISFLVFQTKQYSIILAFYFQ